MELAKIATLIAATITTGLMAGLFFAFTYAVMPGLARAEDRTLVEAMQRINVAIVNVWFIICFLGALAFSLLAAVLHLRQGAVFAWAAAGFVLYAATLLITVRFNVPLNNALDAASLDDARQARASFEVAWVRWNLVRVVTSLGAFGCLVGALVAR